MDIIDILNEKASTVSLGAKTKPECLLELARLISFADPDSDVADLVDAFEAREAQGSTGFENGIAIPHARLKNTDKFILGIAVSKKGIDFNSVDGKKCQIFFALVGPENQPRSFLQLLAQISLVTKSATTRKEFLNAKTPLVLKEIYLENIPGGIVKKPEGSQKLLTIVLYETQYLDDIGQLLLEQHVRGASVVDSTGMHGVLSNVPLFADFLNFLDNPSESSKTITAIVAESQIAPIVEGLEEIIGDLDAHTGAAVYATDLSYLKGSLETI
jgi:mannitol/fructose-specific phosphotransferase system IIA component (Ntr-type)